MKYLEEYQQRIGGFINYVAIIYGTIGLVIGLILLLLNRKFLRLAEFISTSFFFGMVGFETGSIVYFSFVGLDKQALNLFWITMSLSLFLGLGSSVMILLFKPLRFLGAITIGLAGGFSLMNLFASGVGSDSVLLVCSVLFGLIAGGMSHVYKKPFQIIMIPITGAYLLKSGFKLILDACLDITSITLNQNDILIYCLSYALFILNFIILASSAYYHYRVYYLRKVQYDMIENEEALLKLRSSDQNSSIQLPSKARRYQRKLF